MLMQFLFHQRGLPSDQTVRHLESRRARPDCVAQARALAPQTPIQNGASPCFLIRRSCFRPGRVVAWCALVGEGAVPNCVEELEYMAALDKYLTMMVEHGASDLHYCTGCRPIFRKDGGMAVLRNEEELSPETTQQHLFELMPAKNREEFDQQSDGYRAGNSLPCSGRQDIRQRRIELQSRFYPVQSFHLYPYASSRGVARKRCNINDSVESDKVQF